MQTIWKEKLTWTLNQLRVPVGAKMLTVQMQYGDPCAWFLCDPAQEDREIVTVTIYGTGHELPSAPGRHLGTFQLAADSLVFHAFEDPQREAVGGES